MCLNNVRLTYKLREIVLSELILLLSAFKISRMIVVRYWRHPKWRTRITDFDYASKQAILSSTLSYWIISLMLIRQSIKYEKYNTIHGKFIIIIAIHIIYYYLIIMWCFKANVTLLYVESFTIYKQVRKQIRPEGPSYPDFSRKCKHPLTIDYFRNSYRNISYQTVFFGI